MFYSILPSFPTIKLFAYLTPSDFSYFTMGTRKKPFWVADSRDPTYFYYYLHCRHVKIATVTPTWEQTSIAFKIGKCNAVTMDERSFRNAYRYGKPVLCSLSST
jgi:hypothetical protein